jgi:hypothetical protein
MPTQTLPPPRPPPRARRHRRRRSHSRVRMLLYYIYAGGGAISGRGWIAMKNCNNCGGHLITLSGVYQGGKCSIEMNAVRLPPPLPLHVLLPVTRFQVDGVWVTGDLPLLSLGRKIVIQPRHLLHIAARGGSELEFTSIASTLTGLKVMTRSVTRLTSHVSVARLAGKHSHHQRRRCCRYRLRVRHPAPNYATANQF